MSSVKSNRLNQYHLLGGEDVSAWMLGCYACASSFKEVCRLFCRPCCSFFLTADIMLPMINQSVGGVSVREVMLHENVLMIVGVEVMFLLQLRIQSCAPAQRSKSSSLWNSPPWLGPHVALRPRSSVPKKPALLTIYVDIQVHKNIHDH